MRHACRCFSRLELCARPVRAPRVGLSELRAQFEARQLATNQELSELRLGTEDLVVAERQEAWRRALMAARDAVTLEHADGRITAQTQQSLLADIDARLVGAHAEHE